MAALVPFISESLDFSLPQIWAVLVYTENSCPWALPRWPPIEPLSLWRGFGEIHPSVCLREVDCDCFCECEGCEGVLRLGFGGRAVQMRHPGGTQHACCDCMGQAEKARRLGLTMVKLNENEPLCMRTCARPSGCSAAMNADRQQLHAS